MVKYIPRRAGTLFTSAALSAGIGGIIVPLRGLQGCFTPHIILNTFLHPPSCGHPLHFDCARANRELVALALRRPHQNIRMIYR